jgi:hypothetical protein
MVWLDRRRVKRRPLSLALDGPHSLSDAAELDMVLNPEFLAPLGLRWYAAVKIAETAAQHAKIAQETARTQLKSIFAKTGTHRQSELALLLTRFGVPGE